MTGLCGSPMGIGSVDTIHIRGRILNQIYYLCSY